MNGANQLHGAVTASTMSQNQGSTWPIGCRNDIGRMHLDKCNAGSMILAAEAAADFSCIFLTGDINQKSSVHP